jgi:Lon protease-like protein
MLEMPLFPLNTVLFPGMPINLHIFEDRYKAMMQRCIDTDLTFGVVLIEQGAEAAGPLARPHLIGCTAHITRIERLGEGRLNIMAIGRTRFRIHTLDDESEPYLVGRVELEPLAGQDDPALVDEARLLRKWVGRYLMIMMRAGQSSIDPDHLPGAAMPLAYLTATLLQTPPHQKQGLLAASDARQFLRELRRMVRREVALLHALLEDPERSTRAANFRLN